MADKSDRPKDAGILAIKRELQRRRALKQPIATGGELAERLALSKQALSKWRRVPATRVSEVEKLIGVSRHVMRPDVFGSGKKLAKGAHVRKRSR